MNLKLIKLNLPGTDILFLTRSFTVQERIQLGVLLSNTLTLQLQPYEIPDRNNIPDSLP